MLSGVSTVPVVDSLMRHHLSPYGGAGADTPRCSWSVRPRRVVVKIEAALLAHLTKGGADRVEGLTQWIARPAADVCSQGQEILEMPPLLVAHGREMTL